MDSATKPSARFVYCTYTNQTQQARHAMAEVLRSCGCDGNLAAIEFTRMLKVASRSGRT
jgi:hypothetical protein